MLNDVRPPPLDARDPPAPVHREIRPKKVPSVDRAHALERSADHHGGTNLLFGDPEDRGDSFNTTMSAVIVGGVLATLAITSWLMWR